MYGLTPAGPRPPAPGARVHRRADPASSSRPRSTTASSPTRSTKAHHERAIELGLLRHQHARPRSAAAAARRCSRCWSRSRPAGSPTARPGAWRRRRRGGPTSPTTTSARRWLLPTVRGEKEECYAITEEDAGSDVADLHATARRDGDDYVLDGVKWHVTSFNEADYVFFQARADRPARTPATRRCSCVDKDAPGVRVVRTPAYTHTLGPRATRSSRSRTCGCRPPTSSAARRTACPSSTSGSASSG